MINWLINYIGTPLRIIDTYLDSFFLIDLFELYFSDFFQIINVSFRPHAACLSDCLFFFLFVCLFVCPYICLSIYLSVFFFCLFGFLF